MKYSVVYLLLIAALLSHGFSPATAQSSCSSGGTGTAMALTVPNLSTQTLNVYWLDYACTEQFIQTIDPGDIFYQDTYDGHEWVFRDGSGAIVEQFTASTGTPTVMIGGNNYQPEAITSACSSAATNQAIDLTVINNTDKIVLVNWIDYTCIEQVYALVPGKDQFIQSTFVGSDWVVRLKNGKVGRQLTVSATDNVVIIDPPPGSVQPTPPSNQGSTPAAPPRATQAGSPPALTGRIAFANWDGTQYDIYTMNADGSDVQRLTDHAAHDYDPVFAPDGSQITFISERDGNPEIYLMNADGSNQTRLTNNSTEDYSASFSPDGSRIVFRGANDFEGDAEIYVMNADGSNMRQLTGNTTKDSGPRFSPDGSRIAFVSDREGNDDIYIMDADGSNAQRLTNDPAHDERPRFTPDGSRIMFSSDRDGDYEVFIMNLDGSDVQQLTTNTTPDAGSGFSADGTWILFTHAEADEIDRLFVMRADGTGEQQLADFVVSRGSGNWYDPGSGTAAPTSAGGTGQIVFVRFASDVSHIYSMNADGSNVVQLTTTGTENLDPRFAPDGSRIIFYSIRDGHDTEELYVMNADGTNLQRLTNNTVHDFHPNFSPDGSRIVYVSEVFDDSINDWNNDIYLMNVDGTNVQRLTTDRGRDRGPRFSPDGRRVVFHSDRDGDTELYSMNIDGSDVRQLTSNTAAETFADYSPDGSLLVFRSDRDGNSEIYVMNADGTNQQRLTNTPEDEAYPVFTTDGMILFSRFPEGDGTPRLMLMNADGTNVTPLPEGYSSHWHGTGVTGNQSP